MLKQLEQENDAAEEVCPRIALLPEEIKIYTLYFLRPRLIKKPPVHLLRAVLQVEEPTSTRVGQVHLSPHASYQRGQVSPQVGSEGKPGSNLPSGQAHLCTTATPLSAHGLFHKEAGMQSFQHLQTTVLVLSGFSMWSLDADVDAVMRLCQLLFLWRKRMDSKLGRTRTFPSENL